MRHWANGGLTNLDNLITLCGRHHNAVHELGWSMRGDANGEVTFVTPTGQTMISVPSPTWRAQSESLTSETWRASGRIRGGAEGWVDGGVGCPAWLWQAEAR